MRSYVSHLHISKTWITLDRDKVLRNPAWHSIFFRKYSQIKSKLDKRFFHRSNYTNTQWNSACSHSIISQRTRDTKNVAEAAWNYMRCTMLMQQDIECLRSSVRGNTKRLPPLPAFGTSYWRLVSKINLPDIYQLIQIRPSHNTKGSEAKKGALH